MASLVCSETGVVCISGTTFAIISIRDGALERQDIDIEEKRLSSLKENAHEDNGKVTKSATDITSKDGQNRILACKFSPSWRYFAACDDAKRLYLFQCGERWELVSNRAISRRCTVLTFTKDEQDVLVADKWGDVFRFSVTDPQKEGLLLLGHLSMLLDILTTKGDKYVVTTDRDNKIRISEYPNSYNIHTYCLHHTEYVSSVVYNEDPEILLSGSGDGTIVIWDLNGKVVSQTTCSEGEETLPIKKLEWEKDLKLLSVIFFNSPVIQLYMLAADSMSLCRQRDIELTSPVWDACFDRNGQLWVLQKQEGDTLQVYTCQKTDSGVIKVGRIDPELPCSENKVLEMFNKDWTFFSVSESAPDLSLEYKKKETPDNYSIYLQKKQDRINQTQPAEPQAKKVKTT
uniref:tRNA (guanine-N(7)-)-methyltransferase non-catalytic subunit n=1 Tax=Magallana gigas TaxID=29159 RepID=A0A8W8NPR5_MAGGI|nr:tRNA (guanine-N(7)-)-methyltransferase non-catalytic subunit wdr4 isoform X1 [Crassostrea gigas]XP_034337748.1 tRNA (guanine-N(7)-)-methyltransferase non-catalytic subunit wdr4 isoform X1 [Crassostrea gigas]XP_034337756.1 tRNA (guanine-N(7)-)-methyltransferase non-catalytic subunit wdr4 isoform X2 [Crassostrea gigas]XP_034337760.1 tRNA (guanine-N(7)-)-methyltransferase non-catalytic subunit wdr4 isoform X3 [Crassostrea gigas]